MSKAMKDNVVRVPQLAWFENNELELSFPSSWDVNVCYMKGHRRPHISEKAIREAFANPIGTKRIREAARGKKEVAILFDDMTRPTKVAEIVPYVLEELEAAGVKDKSIRFIAALAAHGALTRLDFVKKLGESVVRRFRVYNHNCYDNCTFIGNTSRGTPLHINTEFMNCDFKIGIGSIVPHPLAGFAGGGKIILPGVASMESILANHATLSINAITRGEDPKTGVGTFEENQVRLDMTEAARMAGLDIKIDAVVNGKGETTALLVGDVEKAHIEGVKLAREVYITEPIAAQDIAVLNTYCKANEACYATFMVPQLLPDCGGDLVIIANAPDGQVVHYLAGVGGKQQFPRTTLPEKVNRLIVLTPYIDIAGGDWFGPPESIVWAKTWPEVLDRLTEIHGEKAKVAVVPDATIQYFPLGQ
jgi:lactate racemase